MQVDQGLGIGTQFPLFNRYSVALTRFLQLRAPAAKSKAPPISLVAHTRYAGCVGDMPSYDYFTLGGPYSVRGYNIGELAASRRILEAATEIRVPILNKQVRGPCMMVCCESDSRLWIGMMYRRHIWMLIEAVTPWS